MTYKGPNYHWVRGLSKYATNLIILLVNGPQSFSGAVEICIASCFNMLARAK